MRLDSATRFVAIEWLSVAVAGGGWVLVTSWLVSAVCASAADWLPYLLLAWLYLPVMVTSRSAITRALGGACLIAGIILCDFQSVGMARHALGILAAVYATLIVDLGRRVWRSWNPRVPADCGLFLVELGFMWVVMCPGLSSNMPPKQVRRLDLAFNTCGAWIMIAGVIVGAAAFLARRVSYDQGKTSSESPACH